MEMLIRSKNIPQTSKILIEIPSMKINDRRLVSQLNENPIKIFLPKKDSPVHTGFHFDLLL
jgi:hypothetical protein